MMMATTMTVVDGGGVEGEGQHWNTNEETWPNLATQQKENRLQVR